MVLIILDRKLRLGLSTLLLSSVFLASGCASWDSTPGVERVEPDTGWASQFRLDSHDARKTGFDPQAREIESNLGVE
jgi:hypothetical protein